MELKDVYVVTINFKPDYSELRDNALLCACSTQEKAVDWCKENIKLLLDKDENGEETGRAYSLFVIEKVPLDENNYEVYNTTRDQVYVSRDGDLLTTLPQYYYDYLNTPSNI